MAYDTENLNIRSYMYMFLLLCMLANTYICDCLSQNPPCSHQNWIQFYCRSLQTHSISIHPLCIKCQMLTGLLFSRAFCRPSRVTAGTMGPMEGANWTVRTCICSHWLFGPLECYWPLCRRHGCSWSVPRDGFCPLPPHPPHPSPSHPTPPRPASPPIPPTPSIINQCWRQKGTAKNTLKFSHQRQRRLAIIENNR